MADKAVFPLESDLHQADERLCGNAAWLFERDMWNALDHASAPEVCLVGALVVRFAAGAKRRKEIT
ncbi:hypothetical protein D3C85_1791110 [compost metagenome]